MCRQRKANASTGAHNSLHSGQYGGVFTSLLAPPMPANAAAAASTRGNVAFHDPRHVQLHPGGVAVHAALDMPLKTPGSDSGIWMDADTKQLHGAIDPSVRVRDLPSIKRREIEAYLAVNLSPSYTWKQMAREMGFSVSRIAAFEMRSERERPHLPAVRYMLSDWMKNEGATVAALTLNAHKLGRLDMVAILKTFAILAPPNYVMSAAAAAASSCHANAAVGGDGAMRFVHSLLAARPNNNNNNNNVANQPLVFQHQQQHSIFAPSQQPQQQQQQQQQQHPSSSKRCSTSSSTGEAKKSSPSKSEPATSPTPRSPTTSGFHDAGIIVGAAATAPPSLVGSRSHHGSNRNSFNTAPPASVTFDFGGVNHAGGVGAHTTTPTANAGTSLSTPTASIVPLNGIAAAVSAPTLNQQQQLMQQPKTNFVHIGSFPHGEML